MDRQDPILYLCTGLNEHGVPCRKLLFVFVPPLNSPIPGAGTKRPDLGVVEMKCRRCKTLNVFRMSEYDTAIRSLQS